MNNDIIIKNVSQLYKNLNSDPEFNFLSIISYSKDQHYTYRDLYNRINNYLKFFKKNKIKENSTILIILKESIDTYASFLSSMSYGAMPAFYAYPSEKQNKEVFLHSIDNLIKYNNIDLVVTFKDVSQVLVKNKKISKKKIINFSDIDFKMKSMNLNLNMKVRVLFAILLRYNRCKKRC